MLAEGVGGKGSTEPSFGVVGRRLGRWGQEAAQGGQKQGLDFHRAHISGN